MIAGVLRAALAWLFALAAFHKLRDPAAYAAIVRGYELVPARAARATATLLGLVEAASAVALLVPAAAPAGARALVALLALYSAAIAANLARGRRDLDCGCLGPAHRQPLSGWLLARNALLAAAALACARPVAERALAPIDALTLAAGTLVLCLLLAAATRLLATAPASARRSR